MNSHLTYRKQKAIFFKNNTKSTSALEDVSVQVPRGSILGPILFVIIYIHDLEFGVNSNPILYYADYTKGNELELFNKTTHLSDWFDANGNYLNLTKYQIVKFKANQSNYINKLSI